MKILRRMRPRVRVVQMGDSVPFRRGARSSGSRPSDGIKGRQPLALDPRSRCAVESEFAQLGRFGLALHAGGDDATVPAPVRILADGI